MSTRIPFGVLGPDEIAVVAALAYDLALMELADGQLVLENASVSDLKAKMGSAILGAFRTGITDVQVLKIAGVSAVTARMLDPGLFTAHRQGCALQQPR